jgi:ribonuclease D
LREVYAYRERQAERQDVPPFKVMNDQTLLAIAQTSPRSLDDLRQLHGMTPGQIHRHGAHLLHAVQRGLRATPPTPPPFEREADEVRERYDRLRQWRKQRAQARGVESDVIVPREALWELARRAPKTLDDLQHMAHLGPWRRQTYGPELLRVLHG